MELDPEEIAEKQLAKEKKKALSAMERARVENLEDAKSEAETLLKLQVTIHQLLHSEILREYDDTSSHRTIQTRKRCS